MLDQEDEEPNDGESWRHFTVRTRCERAIRRYAEHAKRNGEKKLTTTGYIRSGTRPNCAVIYQMWPHWKDALKAAGVSAVVPGEEPDASAVLEKPRRKQARPTGISP